MARSTYDEIEYLRGRIRQEDQLAKSAASPLVGGAHASLAQGYRRRMQTLALG